ncbi:MAG: CBS domain-containing protein [Pseudomonadota bacterium]
MYRSIKEVRVTVQRIIDSLERVERNFIAPDATVRAALAMLAERNVGALVVSSDGDKVEGIISERDIVRGLVNEGDALLDGPVSDLMTEKVVTCVATDRASGIMAVMISKYLRHMPIVDDGKYVGMLSIRDLLQLRLTEVQSEADAMRSYIAGNT